MTAVTAPPAIPPYAVGRVRQRALGTDPPVGSQWRYQKGKFHGEYHGDITMVDITMVNQWLING